MARLSREQSIAFVRKHWKDTAAEKTQASRTIFAAGAPLGECQPGFAGRERAPTGYLRPATRKLYLLASRPHDASIHNHASCDGSAATQSARVCPHRHAKLAERQHAQQHSAPPCHGLVCLCPAGELVFFFYVKPLSELSAQELETSLYESSSRTLSISWSKMLSTAQVYQLSKGPQNWTNGCVHHGWPQGIRLWVIFADLPFVALGT